MPLVLLKCPQCGGELQFEESREFGYCQFCGSKIMIEKEPINNSTSFHSDVININYNVPYGDSSFNGNQQKMLDCVLCRSNTGVQHICKYTVIIDGLEMAVLGLGKTKTKTVKLTPGEHTITVKVKWMDDYTTTVNLFTNMKLAFGIKRGFFKNTITISGEILL